MKNLHDVYVHNGLVSVGYRGSNLVAMDREAVLNLVAFLISKHNTGGSGGVITSQDIIGGAHARDKGDRMKDFLKKYALRLSIVFLAGCAGFQRDCSSSCASQYGADWIILQYGFDGAPINCWQLHGVAVTNEQATDGIYWKDEHSHLIHISGWYNRVQVTGSDFASAAKSIGVDPERCLGGAYKAVKQ